MISALCNFNAHVKSYKECFATFKLAVIQHGTAQYIA
jgi:hypothetical protein